LALAGFRGVVLGGEGGRGVSEVWPSREGLLRR